MNVAIIGMTAPTIHSIAVAEAHLAVQMPIRDTGFDATQASVPRSRSVTRRLIAAKIATITKICVPTAVRMLSVGDSEIAFDEPAASSGNAAMTSELL